MRWNEHMVKTCSPFIDHNNGMPTANQRAELSYSDLLGNPGYPWQNVCPGFTRRGGGKPLKWCTKDSMTQQQNTNKMAASKLTNHINWDKQMTMDETKWMWTAGWQDKMKWNIYTQKDLNLGITCTNKYQFFPHDPHTLPHPGWLPPESLQS